VETLRDQLKRHEGYRQHPYEDSVGKLTVGYGRNLDDVGVSEVEADIMLKNDMDSAKATLTLYLPWAKRLSQARFDVLHNMAFNMGIGKLVGFVKMLSALRAGDFDKAADEMLDSLWAQQVGTRATELAAQMRNG